MFFRVPQLEQVLDVKASLVKITILDLNLALYINLCFKVKNLTSLNS